MAAPATDSPSQARGMGKPLEESHVIGLVHLLHWAGPVSVDQVEDFSVPTRLPDRP